MVFFVVRKKTQGSAILRGLQISEELSQYNIESKVIVKTEIPPQQENSLFIWIKEIDVEIVKQLSNNIHVYDVIDNYMYRKNRIGFIINSKIVDHFIVNNEYMKTEICENHDIDPDDISVILHHWDPRISTATKLNQDNLTFGFLGSVGSFRHTVNFLHYEELSSKYKIKFYDTEIGKDVSETVYSGQLVRGPVDLNAISNLKIDFNCHVSIRENDSPEAKYKTSAKLATASALNHNIVTTHEHAIKEVLPNDYPFLLKSTDIESIVKMFDLIKTDYSSGKVLWDKGLKIMKSVKHRLAIQTIITDYVKLINKVQGRI